MPSSGYLAGLLGWEYIFYIQGGLGFIWCLAWTLLISDSPRESRFLGQEELDKYGGEPLEDNKVYFSFFTLPTSFTEYLFLAGLSSLYTRRNLRKKTCPFCIA